MYVKKKNGQCFCSSFLGFLKVFMQYSYDNNSFFKGRSLMIFAINLPCPAGTYLFQVNNRHTGKIC